MSSTDDTPATDDRNPFVLTAVAVVALLTLAYAVFFLGRPLAWVGILLPLVALYLFWRLVRAHERIAAALE